MDLVYCPKCGKEQPPDTQYCDRCGQKINEPVNRVRIDLFRDYSKTEWLDGVGFGVFLIVVASVLLRYSWFFDEFSSWLKTWQYTGPTMIPPNLIPPIFYFFVLMGAWGILEGLIRISLGAKLSRGLRNMVGGGFSIGVAFILRTYSLGRLSHSNIFPAFIILFALMIIISGIVTGIDNRK